MTDKIGRPQTHGVFSLDANPLSEWPADKRDMALQIADGIQDPEVLDEWERRRVARGLVILEVLEAYIEKCAADGNELEDMTILTRWPAFQNSAMRAIKQVRSRQGKAEPKNVTEALKEMGKND